MTDNTLQERHRAMAVARQNKGCSADASRAQPAPAAGVVDSALRYLFQVGYNVAHADCTLKKPYDGDAGKNYDIYHTREHEASVLRALAATPAPSVGEDEAKQWHDLLATIQGACPISIKDAASIARALIAAGVIRGV